MAWKAKLNFECLDLNATVWWDHHRMPTVEEVAYEFTVSHCFIRVDLKSGYLMFVLDYESSLFRTFNNPFQCYRFLYLPFGLVCSQAVLQQRRDQNIEEIKGAVSIANDITLHGHKEEEHYAHLQGLIHIAHRYGLVFNATRKQRVLCSLDPLQSQWSMLWPTRGSCPCLHASTLLCQRDTGIPGNGHIPGYLYTMTFWTSSNSMGTDQERCCIHLKATF